MSTWSAARCRRHFAAMLARQHVKVVLTGEGADELFAGYGYHHAYASAPRQLADELTRSLMSMHNINLQRVDRITMAQGLEARTPFLDRELIDFAQSIPALLKLHTGPDGATIEKWILRTACEDLLPEDLVWRKKAQFDEGTEPWTCSRRHSRWPRANTAPSPAGRSRPSTNVSCETRSRMPT